jgi:hypothetical protein
MANSGRLSHRGRRISLFLQILVLRDLLFSDSRTVQVDVKEFPMKKILTPYGACVLAIALMVPLAQAQPTKIQAAFGYDAGTLSDKFTGLARVMSGKYDWNPGQGVRSVADVFDLIVKENGLLAGVLTGTPNTGPGAHHRSGEDAGSSEGFLRRSAKSDYGAFRQ